MNDNDNIRTPDKPVLDTLIPSTDSYNEELYLMRAIEESLKSAEDEFLAYQLEQINNETLKELDNPEDKLLIEKRTKSLENILYQFIKLKKIDIHFNENLIILENIIKKYINCEIDSYDISEETYNNILNELRNIRIKENELNLIKEILKF